MRKGALCHLILRDGNHPLIARWREKEPISFDLIQVHISGFTGFFTGANQPLLLKVAGAVFDSLLQNIRQQIPILIS